MIRWLLGGFLFGNVLSCQASELSLPVRSSGDFHALFQGMPWQFRLSSSERKHSGENGRESLQRYRFVSVLPVQWTAAGPVHARVLFEVHSFDIPGAALAELVRFKNRSFPDWGISYAWDYIVQQGHTLLYLHADCSMSQGNFGILMKNLDELVGTEKYAPQSRRWFCSCGGGCNIPE